LKFLQDSLLSSLNIRLDEIELNDEMISYLNKNIDDIISKYKIEIDNDLKDRLTYYIRSNFL